MLLYAFKPWILKRVYGHIDAWVCMFTWGLCKSYRKVKLVHKIKIFGYFYLVPHTIIYFEKARNHQLAYMVKCLFKNISKVDIVVPQQRNCKRMIKMSSVYFSRARTCRIIDRCRLLNTLTQCQISQTHMTVWWSGSTLLTSSAYTVGFWLAPQYKKPKDWVQGKRSPKKTLATLLSIYFHGRYHPVRRQHCY